MYTPPPLKVLLSSLEISEQTVTLAKDDFLRLLRQALGDVFVDEAWYQSTYPDVKQAVADGRLNRASEHYRGGGYIEGRLPFAPSVDANWYLAQYPDVAEAIGRGDVESAETHYLGAGYAEGRLPRRIPVDSEWYLATYPAARQRIDNGHVRNAEEDFVRHGYAQRTDRHALFAFVRGLRENLSQQSRGRSHGERTEYRAKRIHGSGAQFVLRDRHPDQRSLRRQRGDLTCHAITL